MDWGRAKTVLILSFLLLNLLLGYQLWTTYSGIADVGEDTAGVAEELNRLLSTKKIELAAEIPKQAPRMREITAIMARYPQNGKAQKMVLSVPDDALTNRDKLMELLSKRREFVRVESYEVDPVQPRSGLIILHQMYGEFPLFDVQLRLFYENGSVTGFQQVYAEEIAAEEELEEHKVLSAYTALRTLAENHLVDGTRIIDVRLGYHGQMYDSEKQVLAPYWRVAVSGGDLYYVHAINGAVEVPQKRREMNHAF